MIISRTPLRITFFGGGTDYPDYFLNNDYGETLGMAINKYTYITLNESPNMRDFKYEISYRIIEKKHKLESIDHLVVRKYLKHYKIFNPIKLHILNDLPAKSGLGSSSSFSVGLIHALMKFKKKRISQLTLAKKAINLEQNLLKENVGCQDQLTCAIGGLVNFKYKSNGNIIQKKLNLTNKKIDRFAKNILILDTGINRIASRVAKHQIKNIKSKLLNDDLKIIKEMVSEGNKYLINLDIQSFGELLLESWMLKRNLSDYISNDKIDYILKKSIEYGAIGGKLLGAGSGGFILLIVKNEQQNYFIKKMNKYNIYKIAPDYEGTVVENIF